MSRDIVHVITVFTATSNTVEDGLGILPIGALVGLGAGLASLPDPAERLLVVVARPAPHRFRSTSSSSSGRVSGCRRARSPVWQAG